ncbi:Granulin [Liparis tanakae]|uniref:Granulin n=1 Tax=Liparis tanakae TaxID=230148 RepID=A0A4Z2FN11_9TELE|nr:Granulin [Liparis tanakae]
MGTVCIAATSSCVNSTGAAAAARVERASGLSKSFRMIKAFLGEEDDSVCPDGSRCPAEFSCLRALTRYGCCPSDQGVPCSDGKHCCPEAHQCSADSRSCIKKERVSTVLCGDAASECPDESTCCDTAEGTWACCPLPEAVCCEDKTHCCPEGATCDVHHHKCTSTSTRKETPMWAKFPARMRADWEGEQVTAKAAVEFDTVPPAETGDSAEAAAVVDVPCDAAAACPENNTCCKNSAGSWSCCPLPEAVCCTDLIHCCPKGKRCNLAVQSCDDEDRSVPWVKKVAATPRQEARVGNVTCDSTHYCPNGSTCCRTETNDWGCCGLPQAVCCDDHEHCCPTGAVCNLASLTCDGPRGSTPMERKAPASSTAAPAVAPTQSRGEPEEEEAKEARETDEEETDEEEPIQCDAHTSCPRSSTCCYMTASHQWGCCPLPQAVCCSDGDHCCPVNYQCDAKKPTCTKGEVVIPWYTKLPARTGVRADPGSVACGGGRSQCPEQTTCCRLSSGEWGCCPIPDAVCCPDEEHCCPPGYTCNMASNSCQKLIRLQLEAVPLTRVYLPERRPALGPSEPGDAPRDELSGCPEGNTCCRTSASSWGCCPSPNAVCCSDMLHCCPTGYTCTAAGDCTQDTGLHGHSWHVFFANKKRALVV